MEQSRFGSSWVPVTISFNILIKHGKNSYHVNDPPTAARCQVPCPSKYADHLLPPHADLNRSRYYPLKFVSLRQSVELGPQRLDGHRWEHMVQGGEDVSAAWWHRENGVRHRVIAAWPW